MAAYDFSAVKKIGVFGEEGGVTGLMTPFNFCWGDKTMAPSFLTDGGKGTMPGLKLWFNILLHVIATILVIVANGAFFNSDEYDTKKYILNAFASCAIAFQLIAVLGTVLSTALVRNTAKYALLNSFGIACFTFAIFTNALMYDTHFDAQKTKEGGGNYTPTVAEASYPASIFFQLWAFGSILANAISAATA